MDSWKWLTWLGIKPATFIRVGFDFVVSALVMAALVLGRTWLADQPVDGQELLHALGFGAIIGSISINVFSFRGFYRQNRTYRPRHKVRSIIQAVVVSHFIFASLVLLFWDFIDFPRSVLAVSAALDIAILAATRLAVPEVPALARLLDRLDSPEDEVGQVKKVLVVGGAGYIGSALIPKLLDRGYEVRILDLLMFGTEPLKDVLDHPNLELIVGDFQDVATVVAATRGVDAVVHLGAIVGDPACEIDPDLTLRTNFLATRMLAEVAKTVGIRRFVFASTCSVYGASDEVLDEYSQLNPVSLYARTKIACEETLADLTDADFRPTNLRFGTIFGFSGRTRFDLVVNLLTAKAIVDRKITVYGGDQWRPFVHVDDAAAGVFAALEQPLAVVGGQTFNIGLDVNNATIGDVAEIINKVIPEAEIVDYGLDGDRRNYRVSFAKARKQLHLDTGWTIEQGVRQVMDAIQTGEVSDYQDPLYSNVKSLKQQVEAAVNGVEPSVEQLALSYRLDITKFHGEWTDNVLVGQREAAAIHN